MYCNCEQGDMNIPSRFCYSDKFVRDSLQPLPHPVSCAVPRPSAKDTLCTMQRAACKFWLKSVVQWRGLNRCIPWRVFMVGEVKWGEVQWSEVKALLKLVCYTCGLTTLETGYCCFSYMYFVLICTVVVLYCFVVCVCVCVYEWVL